MSFGKLIAGSLLVVGGVLAGASGVFIFVQNPGWQSGGFAIGALAGGFLLLASGWGVFRGEKLRDVMDDLISGFMWW